MAAKGSWSWLGAGVLALTAVVVGMSLGGTGARALGEQMSLRDGLPEIFDLESLSRDGWIPFPEDPNSIGSPLGTRVFVNDEAKPINDVRRLEKIFREERAAFIPPGTKIHVYRDSDDREVWDYPVGTQVVHPIWFKTQGCARLFELRLVKKISAEDWAFGMYTPPKTDPFSPVLELKSYQGLDDRNYALNLQEMGNIHLSLKGIQLESCQVCHFMHSTSAYQYPSMEQAGPCSFGPANAKLRAAWTAAHIKLRGYDPFVEKF